MVFLGTYPVRILPLKIILNPLLKGPGSSLSTSEKSTLPTTD